MYIAFKMVFFFLKNTYSGPIFSYNPFKDIAGLDWDGILVEAFSETFFIFRVMTQKLVRCKKYYFYDIFVNLKYIRGMQKGILNF